MQTGRDFFLNEEQQLAVQTILKEWDQKDKSVYLLHGVTGSGKTEVYMELIDFVRKQGKQAIFLIPEIALTYQMVLRFYQRFGSRVSILHSRMSAGERYDQYEKAKNGEIDIMIGPRSALFTPFSNLGIIIIDEEQSPTKVRRSLVIMQEKQHRDGPKWKVRSSFWDRQPRRWSRITGQKRENIACWR